jgi:hypothetical protein
MAELNGWTAGDKAALNEPAAHILRSVAPGETYEEITEVLVNGYGDHHLAESFRAQLRRRV